MWKSLEFKNAIGQKVRVIEIPVLRKDNPHYLLVEFRLQVYLAEVYRKSGNKSVVSFRQYLKRTIKWSDYEKIYCLNELKNNA